MLVVADDLLRSAGIEFGKRRAAPANLQQIRRPELCGRLRSGAVHGLQNCNNLLIYRAAMHSCPMPEPGVNRFRNISQSKCWHES